MPVILARWRCGLILSGIKQLQRLACTADRGLAHIIGVAEPGHLARNAAQTKARSGRIIGHFKAPIVEAEALGRAILQVELAIIAGFQSIARNALRCIGIKQAGLVKIGAWVCISHGAYMGRCGSG